MAATRTAPATQTAPATRTALDARTALAVGGGLALLLWVLQLVRLGRGVVVRGTYWSRARGVPGGLVYVALGDSAAQAVGASRPDRGYVGLLAERMRCRTGCEVLVVNLSESGATVRDVLERQLPKLRALRPDVITLAVGGNDVPFYDAPRFATAVEELTAALPAGTYVADVPYFMHGRWERHAEQAGRDLTASATAHGLTVVALHDAARSRGWRAMLTDFAADWYHPNDRGHQVWADAFWEQVQHSPVLAVPPAPAARAHT